MLLIRCHYIMRDIKADIDRRSISMRLRCRYARDVESLASIRFRVYYASADQHGINQYHNDELTAMLLFAFFCATLLLASLFYGAIYMPCLFYVYICLRLPPYAATLLSAPILMLIMPLRRWLPLYACRCHAFLRRRLP